MLHVVVHKIQKHLLAVVVQKCVILLAVNKLQTQHYIQDVLSVYMYVVYKAQRYLDTLHIYTYEALRYLYTLYMLCAKFRLGQSVDCPEQTLDPNFAWIV